MKCVCPMGGDRTCPDDCPLAIWADLPAADRKAQRKPVAEKLYKQGFTMEQIATQLGVSFQTISRDLKEFSHDEKIKKPAKTATNPKGAGRPKGSGKKSEPKAPKRHYKETEIIALADQGKTIKEVATETGIGQRQVRHVVERERIRREAQAEPKVEQDDLSLTAQQKLEIAIRQYKHKLDLEFEQRVLDECRKRIDEIILPQYLKEIEEAHAVLKARKGIISKAVFRKILACLHPDLAGRSPSALNECFQLFKGLETVLLSEAESPTPDLNMPRNYEEAMAFKQRAAKMRRAKRGSNSPARNL